MNVVWTRGAVQSLRAIKQYIHWDNPKAAAKVADSIERVVQRLAQFPESGRLGVRAGTRELVIPKFPYVVIYRIAQEVQIIRILHDKQNH